jgi:coatomer subunit beta
MDKPCSLLVAHSAGETPNTSELRAQLEQSASVKVKIDALKKCIAFTLAGEALPGVLMHVIRFVLPQKDHTLKKLLLLYLEALDKVDEKGKLKPEMILIWFVFYF